MTTPVNGIYVLQGINPTQIATTPVGVKAVDLYDDSGNLFTTSQVATMKSGGGTVLGYFSIGEAENYRPYWSSLPSSILGPQDPSWPGDYEVAYWTPQWLSVAENYIQTMINQGYQGAYFDVVDEAFTSWAQQNAPNGDPQGAMVTLVQELANYARARIPNFQIWINSSGAEPMLTNSTLISTINGVYEESLFYQSSTQATDAAGLDYNVSLLKNVTNAGKPVVAIEYVSSATAVASIESQAPADGFGYYIANPDYALNGVDTQGFTTTVTAPAVTFAAQIVTTQDTSISATIVFSGVQSDSVGVPGIKIFNGSTALGAATLNADGTWRFTATLAIGSYALSATATNIGGLTSKASAPFSLNVAAGALTGSNIDGTTTKWTYNSNGSLHDIAYNGLFSLPYNSYDVVYGAKNKPVSATYSNGMSAVWTYKSSGAVHDIAYAGVTGLPYTGYDIVCNSAGKAASVSYSNGMLATWNYTSGGALHDIAYTGVTGQPYSSYDTVYGANGKPVSATYNNGMSAVWTYYADGSSLETMTGGTGQNFATLRVISNQLGHATAYAYDMKNGNGVLNLLAPGVTVTSGPGTLSVTASGDTFLLDAHSSESISAAVGGDTLAFHSGFGTTTISGFIASGASHDTLQFDSSMFSGLVAGSSISDWNTLVGNGAATQSAANINIVDLAHDNVSIVSTLLSSLTAAAGSDLKFI